MDRTAVQRAMWDRLEAEKNELKAEFGARVDRLFDKMKLEVERVYGNVQTCGHDDIATVPRSPSPLTTPNEYRLNSIHHQDNVDNLIITPPAANSPDRTTHQTTEHNSTRTQLLTVNLIDGGQNVDEQSSSPLAFDVASHSQPSSIHHHIDIRVVQTETNPVSFDSPNMSDSSDHHQPESSQQPNSVSYASLTNQSAMNIEHLDEQSDNGHQQQMDNEDPDTNAHNVTVNIKTEPMDCDFVVVKEEIIEEDEEEGNDILIKQEYVSSYIKTESSDEEVEEEIKEEINEEYEDDDEDDCDGYERCLVKKEEVSDDDEVDNEGGLIRGGDNDEVDDERYEVTQPNVDCGQLLSNPSRDRKNDSNANESIEDGGTNLSSEQLLNTANQSVDQTVTQSGDLFAPSTSTRNGSNRTALNQQATISTGRNATKRTQPTSKRSAKRSKQTIEVGDGEDGEDIANEDREEAKVKMLYLNCAESNCNVQLDSLDHLHDHLSTEHRLSPLQCFAINCNARFDNSGLIRDHIKQHHSQDTRFLCAVCPKEYYSQMKAYHHWYNNHLTGQFKCNFVSDCAQVTDTRRKMTTHQNVKHHSQSKHLHCTHPGCTASFSSNAHLKQHQLTHLATNQFHCNWPHCSKQCKLRTNLVRHIRTQHFGLPRSMKEQKAKNIVDLRDPNEYVRVVVDE